MVRGPLGWVATHIPTGSKITPYSSKHPTARQALVEAEQIIAKAENIVGVIQNAKNREGYDAFLTDRCKQLVMDYSPTDEFPF